MSFALNWRAFPEPDGPLCYAEVPWDSELYGFPFYELRCAPDAAGRLAPHLAAWLRGLRSRPALVYAKIPSQAVAQNQLLCAHGFYPVETMVELSLPLERMVAVTSRPPEHARLRPAAEADLPQLVSAAAGAFRADRLHLDTNLPADKADRRFARWLELGWRAGEPVFVLEDRRSGGLIGFFHVRAVDPRTVDLSLGGLAAAYQRSGLGAVLYQSVLTECRARGYRTAVTRVSINNLDIVNLFARLGFSFRNPVTTLHWFQAGAGEGA